jgi:prolyl oligopeptidase
MSEPDAWLWLESLDNAQVRNWVEGENRRTMSLIDQSGDVGRVAGRMRAVLDDRAQIPWVTEHGGVYYNLWRDDANPLGLWRRTSRDEYGTRCPQWETVLDLDLLARQERREWQLHEVTMLEPECRLCLISLSDGGEDAVTVREFDLLQKCFVESGFTLPAAKSEVDWQDQDTVLVSTDFGPDSLTDSGYPRLLKRWHRNTPLEQAVTIYAADVSDVTVSMACTRHEQVPRTIITRVIDSLHSEVMLLLDNDQVQRIEVPEDAAVIVARQQLFIFLTSAWDLDGHHYPTGAVLSIALDAFLAGQTGMAVVFAPTAHHALSGFDIAAGHILLGILDDVVSRAESAAFDGAGRHTLAPRQPACAAWPVAAGYNSNEYFLVVTGFLEPTTLYRGKIGETAPAVLLKQEPACFDASAYEAEQHFAISDDGTRVPYFQIGARQSSAHGGPRPTLLHGYGGFGEVLLPGYLGVDAIGWLERGGVHVVANIRGGGEYGPDWHHAALGKNRHRAYEDFAAIARDLIRRGISTPASMGARGASNGGLLIGNMLTQYPDLFGCLVSELPLLDMQGYTRLGAGASWIGEFGDPADPQQWAFLQTFSPYHQLKEDVCYPPVLFVTAGNDDRTHPAHARKMAARMRAMGHEQVYFYESTEGGHGVADHVQFAFNEALVTQFLWDHLSAGCLKRIA